jgi:hypothetical protein
MAADISKQPLGACLRIRPHPESLTEKAGNKIRHNIGVIARSVSDEAIQLLSKKVLDCFASLAMTEKADCLQYLSNPVKQGPNF